jgi:hypothetical protein
MSKTGKKLGHEIVFKRKDSQKVYSQQSHILIVGHDTQKEQQSFFSPFL